MFNVHTKLKYTSYKNNDGSGLLESFLNLYLSPEFEYPNDTEKAVSELITKVSYAGIIKKHISAYFLSLYLLRNFHPDIGKKILSNEQILTGGQIRDIQ